MNIKQGLSFFKFLFYSYMLIIVCGTSIQAAETTRAFLDGVKYYQAGQFLDAVSAFSKVADTGIKNSKLFYNLGSAYLKTGDLGHAMLWYERALKLTPDDPDLKFNYEYALSQIKDEKENKEISVFRVLFFWKYIFSPKTIQWTAIFFNLVFWLILIIRIIQKKKKILRAHTYLILGLTLIFTLTTCYNYYETVYVKYAVILNSKVSVRSGLTEDSTELFVLHAGTKVKVEKKQEDFFRIYFSEGKIGWVKKGDAEMI